MADTPKALIIAAPHSGSGKTLISLGLCRALVNAGVNLAPAKVGPDYIDPAFLARAAKTHCINLDPWAMSADNIQAMAAAHAHNQELLLIEGVMGLFDGAANGHGSTADIAATLDAPVVLVIDCSHMSQSVAALISGFASHRDDVHIAAVVLNKVASDRHEKMLRQAVSEMGMPVLGVIRRDSALRVPSRHLGLTLPTDIEDVDGLIEAAAKSMANAIDLQTLAAIATPLPVGSGTQSLPPLGQRIAIARDAAFAFIYTHQLQSWQQQGAELSFFSPLANEAPNENADAIFLPGGYPELHGAALAKAANFKNAMVTAKERGALIYGECGGYITLGQHLTDKDGNTHEMVGLLPIDTNIDQPRRILGYRQLSHQSSLPWPQKLRGHEFHYASSTTSNLPALFSASDALDEPVAVMGTVEGRVMGSFAHVIGAANG